MQTNAVIVHSNMSIETILSCIPTTEINSKGGGRFFDIMKEGAGTYSGKGTY